MIPSSQCVCVRVCVNACQYINTSKDQKLVGTETLEGEYIYIIKKKKKNNYVGGNKGKDEKECPNFRPPPPPPHWGLLHGRLQKNKKWNQRYNGLGRRRNKAGLRNRQDCL